MAEDLERDLGALAQVNTFHGFCKHLAHRLGGVEGLTKDFDYYPELLMLVAEDLSFIAGSEIDRNELEEAFRVMDDERGLVGSALTAANYYDATSHNDVVYRVQQHLEKNPDDIPAFPVVVVDEYQDFNLVETLLIDLLSRRSRILIAGDDDQALYGFKNASADFIRTLADSEGIARFDLPYCSRCTEVVVRAVNELVEQAQSHGNLEGRGERQYLCYLPDKQQDSEAHPALIHAACSVNNRNAPYIARYIEEQLNQISQEDIDASHAGKHPTALIVGRLHWVTPVYEYLLERFPDVQFQRSPKVTVSDLDGYRRLARDERSRLGWRILLHVHPFPDSATIIKDALQNEREIVDLLPGDYREHHLQLASLVRKLLAGEELTPDEEVSLLENLGLDLEAVMVQLEIDSSDEPAPDDDETRRERDDEPATSCPSILCTSLVGAKGLSAEYVFILSFVDEQFPKNPAEVSDTEICELIVGLSRTRKACHFDLLREVGGSTVPAKRVH